MRFDAILEPMHETVRPQTGQEEIEEEDHPERWHYAGPVRDQLVPESSCQRADRKRQRGS